MTLPPSEYPPTRLSKLAVFACILGLSSLVLIFFTGIPAMILGDIAKRRIMRRPMELHGYALASQGFIASIVGTFFVPILLMFFFFMLPSHSPELSNRTACSAKLTGIIKSMVMYANDNGDWYPTPSSPAKETQYDATLGILSTQTDAAKAADEIAERTTGNVMGMFGMLMVQGYIIPKDLICKSDPFISSKIAEKQDAAGHWYFTPPSAKYLSYSVTYPWVQNLDTNGNSTDQVIPGAHWRNTVDSSIPMLSDMAPKEGTHRKWSDRSTRTLLTSPEKVQQWNSFNHAGNGQSVGFADAHTEWARTPEVGQRKDNIWTGQNAPYTVSPGHTPKITTYSSPFDTIMIPIRNGNTGAIE